jgi:hypothetical protein
MLTYDKRTIDSAGVFLVGELEKLDPTLNLPLLEYSWSRDIKLREDVSVADETSSFTNTTWAATGGINPNGKNWVGKDSNAIASISLDIGKTVNPLYLWAMELGWTVPELLSSQQIGRPVDMQKYDAMQDKYQMDIDEQVYVGDSSLGVYGLLNSTAIVTTGNVALNAAGTSRNFADKTLQEIQTDVNALLYAVHAATGWKVCPRTLLLPFSRISTLAGMDAGIAGYRSALEWIRMNNYANVVNGAELEIKGVKWLEAATATGLTYARMFAYTNDKKYVRFPLTALQRLPLEYRSLYQLTTYFGRLGVVEFPYPVTQGFYDQI